ncbi:MAG TPA: phosphonate ABC transporter, permease protein PhnE [Candidatus Limnocylindria bacterium]|nr:phosphonate ABC transporter, permease protein PhnE [Candidatus Limnocylindria bacterium]
MAEYFTTRGLPVPRELQQNPLTDWRKLLGVAAVLIVLYVGLQITAIDTGRANVEYAFGIIRQLFNWDFSIMSPRDEFETYRDTAWWKMIETIFLGVMATAFSMVIALPLAFLGARNIMAGNPITQGIYLFIRVLFTIIRSIDVLIVVIVLLVIFGPGNAAGVFGLAFHNIGVLGKLYSEAIEGIDAGPLEAITATGANRTQVVWTAVLPQITNPFISFTIYRLDTNVRLAPILGLVGGGGIGTDLFQSIQLFQYGAAGLIIFMIVFTVAAMDFISAQIRKRLV